MRPIEISLVLVSALLHAVWSVAMKHSRDPLAFNVLQVAATVPVGLALLLATPLGGLPRDLWITLAATGIAHGLYFFWLTRALESADLTLVYPIARSTPAFLPLLAVPLLGERLSLAGALGIGVVVVGIWSVQVGRSGLSRALASRGAGWAYLTLASTVAYSLLDKRAMARFDALPWPSPLPPAVVLYFLISAASACVFAPLALARLRGGRLAPLVRAEWRRALAAAAVSFASYALILEALRTALVSYVVAVRQSSVLFAVILAVVLLQERPGRLRVLGSLAIVAGVALIAFGA